MKYELNRDSSGEILRLIIQKMAAHPASFTPWSYAVWFEHLTGINPALSEAMKRLLDSGEKLSDGAIEEFYAEYVSECNLDIHKLLRKDIQEMLTRLAGFAMETDRRAEGYGDNLQSFEKKLKQNLDLSSLDGLIGEMLTDTESMRGSMMNLKQELEQSRQEVEKLHRELESAKGEALVDPMTGILNRRGFEKAVSHILKQEDLAGKEISMLMVDIDHFKAINDNFGHLVGDKVIRAVADMLKSKVRGQDFVARLGGEEFAVLLPDTPAQGGFSVAEHIRKGIESGRIRTIDSNKPLGGVTVSIGVASLGQGDFTEMMDRADKALYASKSSGRNKTTIHAS